MKRLGWHVAACVALLAGAALGAEPEWSERGKSETLDIEGWTGALDADRLDEFVAHGRRLFTTKFTTLDGAGRPMATQAIVPTKRRRAVPQAFSRTAGPDANSCASCHNDPVLGGAGDFTANAFVSEGFESADFASLDPQFSNERGTNHLFGSGLIELLAREMSGELAAQRRSALTRARRTGEAVTFALAAKGVAFGRITAHPDGLVDLDEVDGVDADLVVRPFSQKGVMTSIRQFSVNAANHHMGMQAAERFGARWTGGDDFDEDGRRDELSDGDVAALVAFQATLPPPERRKALSSAWRAAATRGEGLFEMWGCSACHRRALPLESLRFADPGEWDAAGTLRRADVSEPVVIDLDRLDWARRLERDEKGRVLVPLYGDLKRHKMTDKQVTGFGNELLAQRFVPRDEFQTAELWGVGSTAPYGHRGDMTTLDEAIRAHGGDARDARDAYLGASGEDRDTMIAFLKSLVLPEAPR